jgi:hypothetical protein
MRAPDLPACRRPQCALPATSIRSGLRGPAPGFMRTVRIVLVATAVGAAVGGGVVVSLVDRSANTTSEDSVAARTASGRLFLCAHLIVPESIGPCALALGTSRTAGQFGVAAHRP